MQKIVDEPVTLERIKEIGAAFASRNVDAIVDCFADDGVFLNAKGPDIWGQAYKGKEEIRGYFVAVFAHTPDASWQHTAEYVMGNRAVTEWLRSATLPNGQKQQWNGCDLYTFRGDLIVMKDTYIKVVE